MAPVDAAGWTRPRTPLAPCSPLRYGSAETKATSTSKRAT